MPADCPTLAEAIASGTGWWPSDALVKQAAAGALAWFEQWLRDSQGDVQRWMLWQRDMAGLTAAGWPYFYRLSPGQTWSHVDHRVAREAVGALVTRLREAQ
jgi:hypothetical protein